MRDFKDTFVSREYRFSLGINPKTGGYYLSTPVSGFNRAAEWEAHFAITAAQYEMFRANPATAEDFTEQCRMGRCNHLLIDS